VTYEQGPEGMIHMDIKGKKVPEKGNNRCKYSEGSMLRMLRKNKGYQWSWSRTWENSQKRSGKEWWWWWCRHRA
jgi:hypothetical protein